MFSVQFEYASAIFSSDQWCAVMRHKRGFFHYSPESWQVVNMEYLHFWGWDMQGMGVCRYVLSIEY